MLTSRVCRSKHTPTSAFNICLRLGNNNNSNNNNKMKFHRLAYPSVAIATLSSFNPGPHSNVPVARAFSPSLSIRHNHNQNHRSLNVGSTVGRLSSSASTAPVMDLEEEAAEETEISNNNNDNGDNSEDIIRSSASSNLSSPKVVATATMKSFIPSPNGISGVMAVKLREEDYSTGGNGGGGGGSSSSSISTTLKADEATPKVEGDQQLLSQTGMFGGPKNTSTSTNGKSCKSNQVEDYTGKTVKFSNGRSGTIVAQRPPMAFVLCDFHSYEGKGDDENNNETETEEIISILSSRTSIAVNDDLFGNIIDCYGKKYSTDEDADADANENKNVTNTNTINRAIFSPIPQIKDIALINSPLLTGTAMIDALAPIGKGQNMLVIGPDSGIGQREALIGAIKSQLNTNTFSNSSSNEDSPNANTNTNGNVKCVYALTSQNERVKKDVLQQLKDEGILNDVIVVTARDHGKSDANSNTEANGTENEIDGSVNSSAEAIAVAASACSIAEALALGNGQDTFVVVDDIDQHKSFWDWTTRTLVDIYGVDAVVKDDMDGGASSEMRGFYSSLIQRAGRFNANNGGGSMTLALLTNLEGKFGSDESNGEENMTFSPDDFADSSEKIRQRIAILVDKGISLTPETLRKIQIPVPVASESEKKRRLALQHVDDLVSMSDGQIWFDEALHAGGQRPPIDPQRSITRVGIGADTPCRADAPAMRGLAGGLRFDFAQAASLEGAGANSGAEKQLLKRESYLLAMHQNPGEVRLLSENCVALLASSLGLLDSTVKEGGTAGTDLGNKTIKDLLDHVWQSAPSSMEEIDRSFDLSSSVRSELEEIIKAHLS